MKQEFVVLFFITACAFTAAMVPKEKRQLSAAHKGGAASTPTVSTPAVVSSTTAATTTKKHKEICAPQTPCAWSAYNAYTKNIITNISNSFCICDPDSDCVWSEDDDSVHAYVYRCRKRSEQKKTTVTKKDS